MRPRSHKESAAAADLDLGRINGLQMYPDHLSYSQGFCGDIAKNRRALCKLDLTMVRKAVGV